MKNNIQEIDTLIVGAGQAGIAMSEHLTRQQVPHLVLEKNRVAEAWRTRRWDSLVANGPAWHDRFPGMEFPNAHPDSFVKKESVADYFEAYVEKFEVPVRTGVEVYNVTQTKGVSGFNVETSAGTFHAQRVVSATGAFQTPIIPAIAPNDDTLHQIHSASYRNPDQLPDGAIMVVGAGSSGVQIAEELLQSGREVYLSVGPHDRPPRSYRGRDFVWWLGVLGLWDIAANEPGKEHVTIAVSGAQGGKTIDFRQLSKAGMNLVGRTESFENGRAYFANDLGTNIRGGDANYLSLLDRADEYIAKNGLDLPEEPEARSLLDDPACMTNPTLELDLEEAGINTIIWATGYSNDYEWLQVDAFDEKGKPQHHRGVSKAPGIYFLGLPWLSRRGSTFIWGVWHDAKYIADQIVIQRQYQFYPEHP
ncbi:FAD-dependent oxidoreductase [Marinomonas piezotolerans]|uniref:FAD-dependent oxidoreductase n=1 Tax=Marinomonas piezotolerans TaxID=2213058 RepID=A0A370U7J8_9GAMM|nr:NAD(P)/FAD-dependent oxidoreductase [Marinomonas piezotolerans]RDL43751.1 FAD-dependent oxidoreductase [Marinomonas piezotolerans]